MTTERPGYWVLQAGAFAAALLAIGEGEYNIVDGFIPAPPGDAPPDGYEQDVAPGTLESFATQAQIDGTSYQWTLAIAEADTRLPINAQAVSGTVSGTGTLSGTLASSALYPDGSSDLDSVWHIPAPAFPAGDTLQAAAESNERLPISAIAASGTVSGTGTLTGTLLAAGTSLEVTEGDLPASIPPELSEWLHSVIAVGEGEYNIVDGTVAPVAGDQPPGEPEWLYQEPEPPVILYPDEPLPVNPLAISGTVSGTGTLSGTLQVSAFYPEDNVDTWPAPAWDPPENEILPVNPISISGSVSGTGTLTGALSTAGTSLEVTEADLAASIPPELAEWQHTTLAILQGEQIPVDGGPPPPGDQPPPDDDSNLLAFALKVEDFHGPWPDHDLPFSPKALSGTVSGTGTLTGTLASSVLFPDGSGDLDSIWHIPAPSFPAGDTFDATTEANERLPHSAKAITGTVTGTGTLTGTLATSKLPEVEPPVEWAAIPDHYAPTLIVIQGGETFAESGLAGPPLTPLVISVTGSYVITNTFTGSYAYPLALTASYAATASLTGSYVVTSSCNGSYVPLSSITGST